MYDLENSRLTDIQTEVNAYAKACKRAIELLGKKGGIPKKLKDAYDLVQMNPYGSSKRSKGKKNFAHIIEEMRKDRKYINLTGSAITSSGNFKPEELMKIQRVCGGKTGLELLEAVISAYTGALDRLGMEREAEKRKEEQKAEREKASAAEYQMREINRAREIMDAEKAKEDAEWRLKGGNPRLQEMVNREFTEHLSTMEATNNYTLPHELEDRIAKAYPDVSILGSEYYSTSTIEKSIRIRGKMQNFESYSGLLASRKKGLSVKQLDELAEMVLDTMTTELLNTKEPANGNLLSLFDKLKVGSGLERYKRAYEICEKYMAHLDENEKRAFLSRSEETIKRLGIRGLSVRENHLITPESLRSSINAKVSAAMLKEVYNYKDEATCRNITHHTKLMNVEEISSLYHRLKARNQELSRISSFGNKTEAEMLAVAQRTKEQEEALQSLFANIIKNRIEASKGLTPQQTEILLVKIVREYLHDDIKFEITDPAAKLEANKERTSDKTTEVTMAKEKAKERIFGMSKIKKVISRITGEWKEFMDIINVNELDVNQDVDVENINGMFRR